MKAIIIRKIETEIQDIEDRDFYRETITKPLSVIVSDMSELGTANFTDQIYRRMDIINPENNVRKHYFVPVNDCELWEELISVSEGFINSRIERGIQKFKDGFYIWDIPKIEQDAGYRAIQQVKELSWWRRLFKKF